MLLDVYLYYSRLISTSYHLHEFAPTDPAVCSEMHESAQGMGI